MSDDSSRPALGAVSLCREFEALDNPGSSPQASHDCVPGFPGVAFPRPRAFRNDLRGMGFRTERIRPVLASHEYRQRKLSVPHFMEISSLHSAWSVQALTEG